ncbi:Leucine-rich repeat domain L domain-like, partial [Trinorchestia longiramus]
GAFADLPNLQSLSLTENSLTELVAGNFPLVDQHMTIYLWGNQITTIQPDTFQLPST